MAKESAAMGTDIRVSHVRDMHAPDRMVFAVNGSVYVYGTSPHHRYTVKFYLKQGWDGKLLQYLRLLDRDHNAEAQMAVELSLNNPNDHGDLHG